MQSLEEEEKKAEEEVPQGSVKAGVSFPPLVDWAAPRSRRSGLDMQLVATDPVHAEALTALLRHYPFIVYLGFLLWRKNMLLLGLMDEDAARFKTQPPLFYPRRDMTDPAISDFSNPAEADFAANLGMTGNLLTFSRTGRFIPSVFLQERRPLSEDAVASAVADECPDSDGEDSEDARLTRCQDIGNFISWATRNNQIDVVITVCREMQLSPAEKWYVTGARSVALIPRAASRNLNEMVKQLVLQYERSGSSDDDDAMTMPLDRGLLWAANRGNEGMLQFLLQHKANPLGEHDGGFSPLHTAAQQGMKKELDLMLALPGIDVDVLSGRAGTTILHLAATRGHADVVRYLLGRGSDVKAVSTWGKQTALHFAANCGQKEVIKILVLVGKADLDAEDAYGRIPQAVAQEECEDKSVAVLLGELREELGAA